MKEYWPITCCNAIYKCISTILTARLKAVLPSFISHTQSAFIKGRNIADNILLMHELMRGYHGSGGKPRTAMKIDIMKAYWYNEGIWHLKLGYFVYCDGCTWFSWKIFAMGENCVITAQFSVKMNGSLIGYFKSERGLRQGVPFPLTSSL